MKLGLYGGTFDPVHLAHLIIADKVQEELHLDKLVFMPCYIPPHKSSYSVTDGQLRYDMLKLATKTHDNFFVSDLELKRGDISYTVDTLESISAQYDLSRDELFVIIGADNVLDFHNWRRTKRILELCRIVVVKRPQYDLSEGVKLVQDCIIVNMPLLQISSSAIRALIKDGKSIRYLVPSCVEQFIYSHKLYHS